MRIAVALILTLVSSAALAAAISPIKIIGTVGLAVGEQTQGQDRDLQPEQQPYVHFQGDSADDDQWIRDPASLVIDPGQDHEPAQEVGRPRGVIEYQDGDDYF